jgi:hypothetical protein
MEYLQRMEYLQFVAYKMEKKFYLIDKKKKMKKLNCYEKLQLFYPQNYYFCFYINDLLYFFKKDKAISYEDDEFSNVIQYSLPKHRCTGAIKNFTKQSTSQRHPVEIDSLSFETD